MLTGRVTKSSAAIPDLYFCITPGLREQAPDEARLSHQMAEPSLDL